MHQQRILCELAEYTRQYLFNCYF